MWQTFKSDYEVVKTLEEVAGAVESSLVVRRGVRDVEEVREGSLRSRRCARVLLVSRGWCAGRRWPAVVRAGCGRAVALRASH